jgi:adenylate kinase
MALHILLLGVQGAGKGEQARFIVENYHIPQISTGDLFRAMKTREDAFAKEIQAIMASGKLIDNDTTNKVVEERLALADAQKGVILDGYPRTVPQAEFLEALLKKKGEQLDHVLLFELDLYTAFKRAFGRVSSPDRTQTHNIFFMNETITYESQKHPEKLYPPRIVARDKTTQEEMIRREDDADALSVLKRIDTYVAETSPLVEYYEAKGVLRRLNANQPISDVSEQIKKILG